MFSVNNCFKTRLKSNFKFRKFMGHVVSFQFPNVVQEGVESDRTRRNAQ